MIKLQCSAIPISKSMFDLSSFNKFIEKQTKLRPVDAIDPSLLDAKNFNHCDILPMMAGKLCYLSFHKDKGRNNPRDHVGNLIGSHHGSVLEHSNIGFLLMTSRDISHELVRHRIASYSQLSQRYVNYPEFLIPPELLGYIVLNDGSNLKRIDLDNDVIFTKFASPLDIWHETVINLAKTYQVLADRLKEDLILDYKGTEARKIVNQTARSVLPNCTVTYIVMTTNIRSWRQVCEKRCSRHAAVGIRQLFNQVFDYLTNIAPACFQDYSKKDLDDGTFEISTPNPRV